ncbi:MAG TPA: NADPH:quinone reductase, partial [Elusimicrobiota bacterium]|nr:NADPH:quinone reductase [Elusimicrobiota bacterium]
VQQFGEPQVLRLTDVPDPQAAAGQVVVRIKAAGVNPVDAYIRTGQYAARKPALPYTPGTDAAGVVEAVGDGATGYRTGDRVYIYGSVSGTYAEFALCEQAHVYRLPDRVSFAQGAALGVPYATAYYGLFHRGHSMAGETLLVHGASGGVGTAAVQLARARGLTVIGTAGTPKGRELILREGAHHAVDHHAPKAADELLRLTSGRGVDIILEMLANANLDADLKLLATRGRVVVIGSRGPAQIDPRDTMSRNADIRGMTLFNATPADLAGIHAALYAGLENGTLRPVIGKEFPLAQAAQAHEAVMGAGAHGKVILVP